jgi:hypothetical protein
MSLDTARTSACATNRMWHDGVVKRTTLFLPDELYERLMALIRRRLRRSDPLAKVEGIVQDGRALSTPALSDIMVPS